MKNKIMHFSLFLALALLVGATSPALAHMSGGGSDSMMGSGYYRNENMETLEEEMMGAVRHERMEALMDKMLTGSLTGEEQQEMMSTMRDPNAGPGAISMMMRMTGGQMMGGLGGWDESSYSMGAAGFWIWVMYLTAVVWLIVGILAIIWLWQQIVSRNKEEARP